jgi:hypothetical protein
MKLDKDRTWTENEYACEPKWMDQKGDLILKHRIMINILNENLWYISYEILRKNSYSKKNILKYLNLNNGFVIDINNIGFN